jgi:hypothetical protein
MNPRYGPSSPSATRMPARPRLTGLTGDLDQGAHEVEEHAQLTERQGDRHRTLLRRQRQLVARGGGPRGPGAGAAATVIASSGRARTLCPPRIWPRSRRQATAFVLLIAIAIAEAVSLDEPTTATTNRARRPGRVDADRNVASSPAEGSATSSGPRSLTGRGAAVRPEFGGGPMSGCDHRREDCPCD